MNNSVNNNVNNSANNSANNNATLNNNLGNGNVANTASSATVVSSNTVTPTVSTVSNNTATPVVNTPAINNQNVSTTSLPVNNKTKENSNTYLIVGFFVGFVLLAAIFLLVLLLTGVISNRNRLTCTKTVTEDGYTVLSEKFYKFDGDVYTQVNNVNTYTYTNLTDDVYNQTFEAIINNESNGVTSFGFGTQISREGNIVKITSYNPNFFSKTYKEVKREDEEDGFTCE